MPQPGYNMTGPGSSKDDSLRPRISSNSLTDLLSIPLYQPQHPRGSTTVLRSLLVLPRRTPQEDREFLSSLLSEAMSIIDDDNFFDDDHDDDSADDA
jgi:hypothetical protein